ncbi:MAG: hypothetical protein K1Y36_06130 [Blastocatellia bacterium]|nr:hypothetical protein [Blastocatellia bacterium]
MKKNLFRSLFAGAMCLMLTGVSFAGEIKKEVTLTKDMTVNGVVLKKGNYKVKFDEKTGDFIMSQGKNEVLRTKAAIQGRQSKTYRTEIHQTAKDGGFELKGFAFEGSDQNVVINQGVAAQPNQ